MSEQYTLINFVFLGSKFLKYSKSDSLCLLLKGYPLKDQDRKGGTFSALLLYIFFGEYIVSNWFKKLIFDCEKK